MKVGRWLKRIFASFVALALVVTTVPMDGLVTEQTQAAQPEKVGRKKDDPRKNVKKVHEVKEKRTENSKTWRNNDLSETVEIFNHPVFYQEEGKKEWKEIDNRIAAEVKDSKEKGAFKFQNKANRFTLLFAERADKDLFKLKEGNDWLSYSIVGAKDAVGKVKNKESEILYEDVLKDTDVRIKVRHYGAKEDIVFKKKPAFDEIAYEVKTNLVAELKDQAVIFKDKKGGKEVWRFEPPYLRDARDVDSYKNKVELTEEKGKYLVKVQLDRAFLDDEKTEYPVVLDPTIKVGGTSTTTSDVYVNNGTYGGNNHGLEDELRTGYAPDVGDHRSYIKFGSGMPSLNGGLLTNAKFYIYKFFEPSSIDTSIRIHRAAGSWTSTSLIWNGQPGSSGSYTTKSFPRGTPNGWYNWDVTSLVNWWYDNPSQYHGLIMIDDKEAYTATNKTGTYRKFYSSDYGTGGPYAPRLEVTYSPKPGAPTGTAVGLGSGTSQGYVNLSWQAVPGATGYKVWIYNGKEYEAFDVGNTTSWTSKGKKIWPTAAQIAQGIYTFRRDNTGTELADDPRPLYTKAYDAAIQAGWTPGNQFTDYRTRLNYAFRVTAYNSMGETAKSDALVQTIDDQTKPTKPGTPTVANQRNDQFTISWPASSDTISGVQKYQVFMGTAPGQYNLVNGAEVTTASYTHPTPVDPRTKYYFKVRAIDGKGNVSADSTEGSETAYRQLDASIVSYSIPSPLEVGEDTKVTITVRNEGIEAWTKAKNIMLGSVHDPDHFTNANTRLELSDTDSIERGQTKTFTVTFNGGTAPGLFNTQWKMLKVGTGWFGDTLTQDVPVLDTEPPDAAIVINNGRTFTNNPDVTLSLKAKDLSGGAIEQKLKNEADAAYGPYEPYTATKNWRLSDGNGDKTVSVVFKDASGNESTPASASIQLDTNYPTAGLISPTELEYVSSTTDIKGSATDSDLKEYSLSYGEGDSPTSWTVFHTSTTPVSNGILGTWNPDGMKSGKYTLRLAVTDQAGNTSYEQRYVWIDPLNRRLGTEDFWGMETTASGYGSSGVNLSNGNLVLGYEDVEIDGRQFDPSIGRTYNSQEQSPSLIGVGWRLSVEASVREESNGDVTYIEADGSRHRFVKNADGTYANPKGIFLKLTKNADGTFTLRDMDPTGISMTFNAQGQMTVMADKNNNKLTYVYTGNQLTKMVDDVNREITFAYGSNDLVSEIGLYTGNKVQYVYNTNNLLSEVKFADVNGTVYRALKYEYNADKLLSQVTDPRGNVVTYTYNGLRISDIASKHTAREAATGNERTPVTVHETLTYDLSKNEVHLLTSGETVSQEMVYRLNADGNLVETVTDPQGLNIKESAVYVDNLVKESLDAKGNKTTFEYDALGNVTKKTLPTFTDIDGGTVTPVYTYEYKPGTSLLTKETDPLGRSTTHDYDANGNKTLTVDSDGFKTTYEYDQYGNQTKETTERGPLYGYIPNFSFEEGDTTALKGWKTSGGWAFDTANKKNGARSVKLTGNASVETDYVPIKTGRLSARGLAWVKLDAAQGTGVTGVVTFYDSNKAKISEASSQAVTGTADWNLVHIAAAIPDNAAFVTYKINAATTGGSVYVDSVWMEEANLVERYNYSADGLYLTSDVDPYGRETKYEYDQAGNKVKEINALNQIEQFKYDADRKVTQEIDRLGKTTTNEYDASGNLVKVTNPLNQVVETFYDESNRATMVRNPKVTKVMYVGQTPQTPEVVSITEVDEYNELGQKVAEKDGNGNVMFNEYDKAGRVTKTTDPLKNERRYFYDENDNPVKEEDWAYDTATNTLYKKGTIVHKYDELNQEILVTDATGLENNFVEKSKYDAIGKEIKTVTGAGLVQEFEFDKDDEPVYTKENTTPVNETWALHDGDGNLAIDLDKQGAEFKIYDANENLLQVVDAEGKKTNYFYNEVGDKTKQVDPDGTETTWDYDAEGQLTKETVKLVQPDNSVKYMITEYQYDEIGQLTKKIMKEQSGDTVITTKEGSLFYDELGRVVKESWINEGKKTETRYYFDNNGNQIYAWLYDETTPVPVEKDTDGDGFLNSETKSVYDANNRLIQESVTHSGTTTNTDYTDKNNTEVVKTPLGDTTVYHDDNDLVSEIVTPIGDSFKYQYDKDQNLQRVTAPGVTTNLTFNGEKVATMKATNNGGATVVDLGYTFTDAEQVAQVTDKGAVKKKYTYTQAGYLETVEAYGKKLKYTQDGNGNVTKVENLTTGKTKEELTYASGNRIATRKEYNETTGALLRTTNYTFNDEGTLTKASTTEGTTQTDVEYRYNSEDQLVSYSKTVNGQVQKTVTYEYDPDGNRTAKTVGNVRYEFQRDSNDEIFTMAKEVEGATETVMHFYKDDGGRLLGLNYNGTNYYYQFDSRGDV
ncbi:DNRLRE domain-containing protein, partial [Laceyella putida]